MSFGSRSGWGELRPGQQLPAARELATLLGVSVTTVVNAYSALTIVRDGQNVADALKSSSINHRRILPYHCSHRSDFLRVS
ncbi:GntR family transcriptional regulator [Nocardia sp. CDC160]|uniref:GntR family transcriptional regulator n=1 Tax=Nocardia sp. CDC160 TaxID=3112166 RepID=UPI003FA3ACFE